MAELVISDGAYEKLMALALAGERDAGAQAEHIIEQWHMSQFETALPDGYGLRDDLTMGDIERYMEAYHAAMPSSMWGEYGRALRAAVEAGWFASPAGLKVDKLPPALGPRLYRAVNAHYLRMTIADPL